MTVVCPFVPWGLNTSSVEAPCLFSGLGSISVAWLLGEEPQTQSVCEQEATGLNIRKAKSATWREIAPPATISKGSHSFSFVPSLPTGPPGKYGDWRLSLSCRGLGWCRMNNFLQQHHHGLITPWLWVKPSAGKAAVVVVVSLLCSSEDAPAFHPVLICSPVSSRCDLGVAPSAG